MMSELDALLKDLEQHAQAVMETEKAIRELLSAKEGAVPEKVYALEDVRAVLLAKSKAGFRAEVKALLVRHGAEKLTEIDPKEYPAMMQEAEEISA